MKTKDLKNFSRRRFSIERLFLKLLSIFINHEKAKEKYKTFEGINKFSLIDRIKLRMMNKSVQRSYSKNIIRLKKALKTRKLKVCFLVGSISKWHCDALYNEFSTNEHFEPCILVTKANECKQSELLEFFKKRYKNVEEAFLSKSNKFININEFEPDILFYQKPWMIDQSQHPIVASKRALTCYTPYCFHLMKSDFDYLSAFHRFLWTYFVESEGHIEDYKKRFNATNCVVSGSVHFDNYVYKRAANFDKWNDNEHSKKRIIYAPHFTFDSSHMMSTFGENGNFMLNLASMYPQTTWIFKPHPNFFEQIVADGLMSNDELSDYCDEWEKYGTIWDSSYGNYFDMFKTSDCLITDCISFLADYFPTGNPVIHLRSKKQTREFNEFGSYIIESYYQVFNNSELEKTFSQIIVEGSDPKKSERLKKIDELNIHEEFSASKIILKYLNKKLGIE